MREVNVEGVIFSFPTQQKLDRLEVKLNDIEQGNLTARQPHHHKYRNNLQSVLSLKLDTTGDSHLIRLGTSLDSSIKEKST